MARLRQEHTFIVNAVNTLSSKTGKEVCLRNKDRVEDFLLNRRAPAYVVGSQVASFKHGSKFTGTASTGTDYHHNHTAHGVKTLTCLDNTGNTLSPEARYCSLCQSTLLEM